MEGLRFNPSGDYNAFDTNVFETLALPYRAAGDQFTDDPYGNGGTPQHGRCGGDPRSDRSRPGDLAAVAGECPNHQLEYIRYYKATMKDILGDFGMTFHRYEFDNPGSSNVQSGLGINPAAVVPGASHPEDTVIVSGHFDQTNDGPASAWDSAEGHAQVIRVAKLMADYWEATGSRPAATVKFIPWDAEESGTFGSADYAENNVVPGREFDVRGYWNTDPCAGGYPAFRFGNPLDRVDLGIQLANIDPSDDPAPLVDDTMPPPSSARIFNRFNRRARITVEQVFDHLDDQLTLAPGVTREIFVSTREGRSNPLGGDIGRDVVIGDSRAILFSSDWRNFEAIGVPFFNPGPDITGPSSQLEPGNPDAVVILHTPLDNLKTLNAYSGGRRDGEEFSEGWIKGMEMCAHLLAWGMLRPDQAGATPIGGPSSGPIAYYEALPNEAFQERPVTFDASGSHRRKDGRPTSHKLEYSWDFGDGTTGSGKVVEHSYADKGHYRTTLTVTNPKTGNSDFMRVPITVVGGIGDLEGPRLDLPPRKDGDGTFPLSWKFERPDVDHFAVQEGTKIRSLLTDHAEDFGAWRANRPTEEQIEPWQPSDSETPKPRGNINRSSPRSFWTGVATQDQRPALGPATGTSSLTSKREFQVPKGRSTVLSYWSDFANDANDFARVEVAVTSPKGPLEWETVDFFGGEEYARAAPGGVGMPDFEHRSIDLSQYAGDRIRLRFSYVLGATQFVNVFRNGWYVDDIAFVTADFDRIGRTQRKRFLVKDRAPGRYLYRVQASLDDGLPTAPSNVEQVTVTR
jgi:PKD repeat protein